MRVVLVTLVLINIAILAMIATRYLSK